MKSKLMFAATMMAATLSFSQVQADVLTTTLGPGDSFDAFTGFNIDEGMAAMRFSVAEDSTVTGARAALFDLGSGNVSASIYSQAEGTDGSGDVLDFDTFTTVVNAVDPIPERPDVALVTSSSEALAANPSGTLVSFNFGSGVDISAGVDYWLVVSGDAAFTFLGWAQNSESILGVRGGSSDGGATWSVQNFSFSHDTAFYFSNSEPQPDPIPTIGTVSEFSNFGAFEITGTVIPEPASVVLMGLGGLLMGVRRRA